MSGRRDHVERWDFVNAEEMRKSGVTQKVGLADGFP